MKKGEVVSGVVERVDFPNRGIVRVNDDASGESKRFRVANVIPGQTVSIRIQKKGDGNKSGKAVLVSVDERSAIETEDQKCAYFGICGGCQYLTVDYDEQLKLKAEQIRSLLVPVIGEQCFDQVNEGIKGSPLQLDYRNKMELSFGDSEKDGPLMLGMHRRGSFYDVVDSSGCQIMDHDMRLITKTTLDYFRNLKIPYVNKKSEEGYLRHLLIRRGANTGELLVDLVTAPLSDISDEGKRSLCTTMVEAEERDLLSGWKKSILSLDKSKTDGLNREYDTLRGTVSGILHTYCDRIADVIEDGGTEVLYGTDHFSERILGLGFRVSPFSFFQTNSAGTEVLYETLRKYISDDHSDDKGTDTKRLESRLSGKTVFDLYSGTGTIAQIIAGAAKKVIGVEIVAEAVEAARENARANGISNCEFIAGDVLKVIDEIEEKPDVIILDPPRDGIHPKALPKLISFGVDEIIYVSCKPTSLARDLPAFLDAGYQVTRLGCVDMFPNTGGVEVCCLLEQLKSAKEHIEIAIDAEDYYRIKDSEKKTE